MTRRASLPGVDELFRSQKDRTEERLEDRTEETEVSEAVSLQVANDRGPARVFAEPPPEPQPTPTPSAPLPPVAPIAVAPPPALAAGEDGAPADGDPGRRPRHDEKVTFYCTASDLTRIERARLTLRAEHKLASDRGRIVRAALAEILDDFEANGPSSALVRRLRHGRSS
jgi:hypothetical protein